MSSIINTIAAFKPSALADRLADVLHDVVVTGSAVEHWGSWGRKWINLSTEERVSYAFGFGCLVGAPAPLLTAFDDKMNMTHLVGILFSATMVACNIYLTAWLPRQSQQVNVNLFDMLWTVTAFTIPYNTVQLYHHAYPEGTLGAPIYVLAFVLLMSGIYPMGTRGHFDTGR